jgi:elongation factor P
MDSGTFEQVSLSEDLVQWHELMKEGQEVEVVYHAETERPLSVELPQFVELLVTYTEPGIKGDTATNTTKPATLETGAVIQVPLFIDQDEKIRIDTRTGTYYERVKK